LEHYRVDCVVVGAGVVGIAIARQLAIQGHEVWVLEAAAEIGTEISSRNSEVIHAGIYYPKDSLKAKLCVSGRRKLYRYCEQTGVPHKRCGKLIVATNEQQVDTLEAILNKGRVNGVEGLEIISQSQLLILEPKLNALAAIWSPETGIIDSHQLMVQLQADAEEAGAQFVFNSPVVSGKLNVSGKSGEGGDASIELLVGQSVGGGNAVGQNEPFKLTAQRVINSAGLNAVELLKNIKHFPEAHIPQFFMAKGNYFSLPRKAPFNHLIYPVPESGGLGVHLTLDMAGQARFGPDVEWINKKHYPVDCTRKNAFEGAIQRYWPTMPQGELQPDYAGIRPKLSGPGEADADFIIQGEVVHGVKGLINLMGIESPGLTSCMALADEVSALI
jgi:L-2-hydroxyglutarate oxidase LhgO